MSFNSGSALRTCRSEAQKPNTQCVVIPGRKTAHDLFGNRDLSGGGASGGAFASRRGLRELDEAFVGVPGGGRAEVIKTGASAMPHGLA
jgi:hypothetical protein